MSSVLVFVRVRPFNDRELTISSRDDDKEKDAAGRSAIRRPMRVGSSACLEVGEDKKPRVMIAMDKKNTVSVLNPAQGNKPDKSFVFDGVLWSALTDKETNAPDVPFATQDVAYKALCSSLVDNTFAGFNNCLFAYGQTGSGKTFTMMGSGSGEDRGVSPRLCEDLFNRIENLRADQKFSFSVRASYMEVYNEKVHDLLGKGAEGSGLKVRQHPTSGVFVDGLVQVPLTDLKHTLQVMREGDAARHVAATKMNSHSSRSHSIFTLYFSSIEMLSAEDTAAFGGMGTNVRSSKLNLVDLAGSEVTSKSGVEGINFTEAKNINLSLTTLGRVIDALSELSKKAGATKTVNVPYRDSTLTFILSDSLGGNSKTTMIATVSPHASNLDETINTLRYASRAREIVNVAVQNEDPHIRRIRELTEENERLKRQMINVRDKTSSSTLEAKSELINLQSANETLQTQYNKMVQLLQDEPASPASGTKARPSTARREPKDAVTLLKELKRNLVSAQKEKAKSDKEVSTLTSKLSKASKADKPDKEKEAKPGAASVKKDVKSSATKVVKATKENTEALEAANAQLQEQLQEKQQQLAEALEEVREVTQGFERSQEENDTLSQANDALEASVAHKSAVLECKVQEIDEQAGEVQKLKDQLSFATADLDSKTIAADVLESALLTTKRALQEKEGELESSAAAQREVEEQVSTLKQGHLDLSAKAAADAASLKQQLQTLEKDKLALRQECDKAASNLRSAEAQRDITEAQTKQRTTDIEYQISKRDDELLAARNTAKKEVATLRAIIDTFKKEKVQREEQHVQNTATHDAKLKELEAACIALKADLTAAKLSTSKSQAETTSTRSELKKSKLNADSLQKQLSTAQQSVEALRGEAATAKATHESALSAAKKDSLKAKEQAQQLDTLREEHTSQQRDHSNVLSALQRTCDDLQSQVALRDAAAATLREQLCSADKQKASVAAQQDEVHMQMQLLQKQLQEARAALALAQQKHLEDATALQDQLSTAQDEHAASLAAVQEQCAQLRAQAQAADDTIAAAAAAQQAEVTELQAQLRAAKQAGAEAVTLHEQKSEELAALQLSHTDAAAARQDEAAELQQERQRSAQAAVQLQQAEQHTAEVSAQLQQERQRATDAVAQLQEAEAQAAQAATTLQQEKEQVAVQLQQTQQHVAQLQEQHAAEAALNEQLSETVSALEAQSQEDALTRHTSEAAMVHTALSSSADCLADSPRSTLTASTDVRRGHLLPLVGAALLQAAHSARSKAFRRWVLFSRDQLHRRKEQRMRTRQQRLQEGEQALRQQENRLAQQEAELVTQQQQQQQQAAAKASPRRRLPKKGSLLQKYGRVRHQLDWQIRRCRAQETQRHMLVEYVAGYADVHLTLTGSNKRLERENGTLKESLFEASDSVETLQARLALRDDFVALDKMRVPQPPAKKPSKKEAEGLAMQLHTVLEGRYIQFRENALQEMSITKQAHSCLYLQFEQREYDTVMTKLDQSLTRCLRRHDGIKLQLDVIMRMRSTFRGICEDMSETPEREAAIDSLITLFKAVNQLNAVDTPAGGAGAVKNKRRSVTIPELPVGLMGLASMHTPRGESAPRCSTPKASMQTPRGHSASVTTPRARTPSNWRKLSLSVAAMDRAREGSEGPGTLNTARNLARGIAKHNTPGWTPGSPASPHSPKHRDPAATTIVAGRGLPPIPLPRQRSRTPQQYDSSSSPDHASLSDTETASIRAPSSCGVSTAIHAPGGHYGPGGDKRKDCVVM